MQALCRTRHALQRTAGTARQQRGMHGTRATYGVMDSMRKAYDTALEGNEERKQQRVFAMQMKYLQSEQRVNGNTFLKFIEDMKTASGLGGVREHLPWVSNNPALGELKEQERIMRAFEDMERRDVFGIGIGGMKRVARQVGVDRLNVEAVVAQVQNLVAVQKWVRRRMEKGEAMPREAAEMQNMLRRDGVGRQRGRRKGMNPGIKGGTTARKKFY